MRAWEVPRISDLWGTENDDVQLDSGLSINQKVC